MFGFGGDKKAKATAKMMFSCAKLAAVGSFNPLNEKLPQLDTLCRTTLQFKRWDFLFTVACVEMGLVLYHFSGNRDFPKVLENINELYREWSPESKPARESIHRAVFTQKYDNDDGRNAAIGAWIIRGVTGESSLVGYENVVIPLGYMVRYFMHEWSKPNR